jgi:vancomycin aglycone glucosyltransferase
MRVLISPIGSRGDVQPMLALALELRSLGHSAILCVPPDFKTWVESFDVTCTPIGPDFQAWVSAEAQKANPWLPYLKFMRDTMQTQFQVLAKAAPGCDLIVGGGLQCAGYSIAEALKIPYVYAASCPAAIPLSDHSPPSIRSQSLPRWANQMLWTTGGLVWNRVSRRTINEQRATLGLKPVGNILRHVFTARPWLAADAVLAPAASSGDIQVTQTGAWFLSDPNPLPNRVEQFLADGEPPIYFGFGSMPARLPAQTSSVFVEAARALGRRAVISNGWAGLDVIDTRADCISIGAVNHEKLFQRVAAIVHHGGAGTTTAVARAGKPQIVAPHILDQYYWAHRVRKLGVGVSGLNPANLSVDRLIRALRECLRPEVAARAQELAGRIELRGTRIAAERLIKEFG